MTTVVVAGGGPAAHAAQQGPEPPPITDVGAVVDEVVPAQLAEDDIPGAIVTVVAGDRTVFTKGYGVADVGSDRPMDPSSTGFYTASEAKLFTATAALQLVEEGKLDLNADVNDYLKNFSVPDTYPGKPVTLHNLLTYTSGFDNNIYGWSQWPPDAMPSLEDFAAQVQPSRVRPPGELVAYNNYDFVLTGRLIEIASGRDYADYLAENVFAPLGMEHTTAQQPHAKAIESRLAVGYRPDGDSQAETGGAASPAVPTGADMSTTAPDMARFMRAQLRQDELLGSGVAKLMQSQRFAPDRRVPGMGYAFEQWPRNGQPMVLKDGDQPGFHHNLALLPESDVGIHVVYNGDGTDNSAYWDGKELVNRIVDEHFPAPDSPDTDANTDTDTDADPAPASASDVSRHAGTYEDTRTSHTSFTRVSSLMAPITVEATGKGRLTTTGLSEDSSVTEQSWRQVEPGLFRLKGGSETIAFDDSGALVSSQTPNAAYEKLAWYQSPGPYLALLGVAVLILLVGFFGIPIRMLVRRLRHRDRNPAGARTASVLAWVTALCVPLFAGAFAIVAADPNRLMEIPLTGDLTLSFALNTVSVMGVFTAAVIVAAILAWIRGWWTPIGRVAYTGFTLAAIGFLWVAVAYRLVGVPLVLTV